MEREKIDKDAERQRQRQKPLLNPEGSQTKTEARDRKPWFRRDLSIRFWKRARSLLWVPKMGHEPFWLHDLS